MSRQLTPWDKVDRFGDPWHGLYRNGVLELPNGSTRAHAPTPTRGDCFVVKVPGLPAPTNTAADAAAGRTWLNYALLAGVDHTLYRTNLSENGWVYIDPNNKAWLVEMAWGAGRQLQLLFKRFFSAAVVQSLSLYCTPALSALVDSTVGNGRISDINSTGSHVVIGHELSPFSNTNILLTLSGIPGSATATLVPLSDPGNESYPWLIETNTNVITEVYRYLYNPIGGGEAVYQDVQIAYPDGGERPIISVPAPPDGYYPYSAGALSLSTTTGKITKRRCIGYCFDSADLLKKVEWSEEETRNGYGYNYDVFDEQTTSPFFHAVGVQTTKHWISIGAIKACEFFSMSTGDGILTYDVADPASKYFFSAARVSNKCFTLRYSDISGNYYFCPPVTPFGAASGPPVSDNRIYATCHPVTGQIIYGGDTPGNVCFI